jgi:uncharacterized protein (TIGR00369 family)
MNLQAATVSSHDPPTADYDKESIAFFSQIQWMQSILNNKDLSLRPLSWRGESTWEQETFFAETLNTARTLPHFCMYTSKSQSDQNSNLIALIDLGAGTAGHTGICHGGMTSTLLDEIMGTTVVVAILDDPKPYFTVNLNVDFVRPIAVPGVIMVEARLESREGRKIGVAAEIMGVPKGGEDGKIEVCAMGRALFVTPKASAEQRRPNVVDVMGKIF